MLEIKNIYVEIDGASILKGFSLKINAGEIHAIMGPNGAGKSTLAKVIGGHPSYEVISGDILFQGKSIVELDPEERACLGLFMSFQYPIEIPGVSNFQFLHTAYNAQRKFRAKEEISEALFSEKLDEKMDLLGIRKEFGLRGVNEGFSGGEKKRNEILQMAVLDPVCAILDETDSGLDIDAMRVVANGVNKLLSADKGLILITHYQRLLDYIKPDYVHIMVDGQIVQTGDASLALELEEKGYDSMTSLDEAKYAS